MKVFLVAGARPNFMKIAPLYREAMKYEKLDCQIVHTGQHYDYEMSQVFFDDLDLPRPDFFLGVGSGSHAVQTAKIMMSFEEVCEAEEPDLVIVVGDVNSTLACSLAAKKMLIKIAHVEAGLRSFDNRMPEEINRMVTDLVSDYLFVTEQSAVDNLKLEGKQDNSIHFVGHVMVDNLLFQLRKLETLDCTQFPSYNLKNVDGDYVFLTLHRPSNVDSRQVLAGIVDALNRIAQEFRIFFPVHPRTLRMLNHFDLKLSENIVQLPPLGFSEALFLWKDAAVVLTDSGGMQEETTALGVPCLTIRENTERPITIELGTNKLVGNGPEGIVKSFNETISEGNRPTSIPPKWDGRAAERIWKVLLTNFLG